MFNAQQDNIARMQMYGFIRNEGGVARIDSRVLETLLYNLFLSDEESKSNVFSRAGDLERNLFIEGGGRWATC